MNEERVLVTGGAGFIAGHVIRELLGRGYRVRATVRSRKPDLDGVEFVQADLLDDAGWAEAVAGVDHVLHVASPVRPGPVANEDDLIVPAREGTVRVLRAARDAGVRRVVLTSAFHAAGFGHPHTGHVFTEDDWSVLDGPGMDAYGRSKVFAERAAWEFDRGAMELTTLLPVAVLGPVLGSEISGGNHIVQRMLTGQMPGFPDIYLPVVDVRDVADAHVRAMVTPGVDGERFLIANGPAIALKDIGATLREHLGERAARVPAATIPDEVVRTTPAMRAFVGELGYRKQISNDKARRVLGWQPRPAEEAIVAAGRSLS
ncbi:nucleoside-diphosphate-sugar epimerase [Actinoplanes octamycinicus]|uniref:Nucleoside-diphosphate-sugar epimerase n=1 Tax=Actinoplanes octamycinicus TaxID=135948 RepID=A0A7W7GZT0_9ACTN|nr:aldehyde reductase [Actinoplanes octamycinicus]MBB4741365.1 nucleoside-diphosphate-sugar epimerase [Actinoplanes octamycinicus]GIE62837.1 dihydroflavonol-4-reductase [Actinoplanes octamycinicus]